MSAITIAENISSERARMVDRAISESIGAVPVLKNLRAAGPVETGQAAQGYYNEDDEWVAWWKAGGAVASAPVRPQRG